MSPYYHCIYIFFLMIAFTRDISVKIYQNVKHRDAKALKYNDYESSYYGNSSLHIQSVPQ